MTTKTKSSGGTIIGIAAIIMIAFIFSSIIKNVGIYDKDKPRIVSLTTIWEPKRQVYITYWIDQQVFKIGQQPGKTTWSIDISVMVGQHIKLDVTQHDDGGFLQCMLHQDGKLKDYMHRNDSGICAVKHTVT